MGEGTGGARGYARRTPESALLYRTVAEHVETFLDRFETSTDGGLTRFVTRELRKLLACGILAHGLARVHCSRCHKDSLVAFSCKGRGFCPHAPLPKPRPDRRRRYYSWAELMHRVFRHELLLCPRCRGPRKVLSFPIPS